MSKKIEVQFIFSEPCTLTNRRLLRKYILSIFKREKRGLKELNIIFCNDEYLLQLNRQFLQHDFYTDILSFPLSKPDQDLVGEIYISVDRVRENALTNKSTIKKELHRVIFHGVLHFCGYGDKTAGEIKNMRRMEDKYLRAYL
jgi:rRNA maturation RNase YbeY